MKLDVCNKRNNVEAIVTFLFIGEQNGKVGRNQPIQNKNIEVREGRIISCQTR